MKGHLGETLAVSNLAATRSREWMRRVITLLDAAVGQLHNQEHPAQGTLLEAASLLRQQIDPPAAREVPDGRGRLLAWQARKVRDYIDSHITEPVHIADLCALVQRSEAHFSRSFKRTFGQPPHAFLVRRRVEFAAGYMLNTDASLSDIANAERPRSSHCTGAVLDVELAVDIVEVPLERAFRDENRFGDLLVAQARLQALQDRQLSLRQLFAHADRGATLNVRRAHRALQAARQGRRLGAASCSMSSRSISAPSSRPSSRNTRT
jgi:AraC family transcriptional regulator